MSDETCDGPRASGKFERKVVYHYIRRHIPRQTYLEIGASFGGSLSSFGRLCEAGSLLIAVDQAMPTKHGKKNRGTLKALVKTLNADGFDAKLISGDSTDAATVDAVRETLDGREVDVLFIDGGHEGHIVYPDLANYVPLVRRGGLVIMHDIGPVIYVAREAKVTIRSKRVIMIRNCFGAWADLASRHQRKLIVQDASGYGLVWLD